MNYSDSSTSYTSCASTSAASFSDKNNYAATPDRDFNYVPADASERAVAKGGVACPFPWRLHEMLKVCQQEGLEYIVSWAPHGKAFTVHRPQEFAELIMPRFFCQTKFASFQRQLNLYGFARFCHGRDKGAYYHACFIRGQRAAVRQMIRRKIKGTASALRRPLPTEEPNFYQDNEPTTATTTTAASVIPPYISYHSARTISHGEESEEQPVLATTVSTEEDDNLAFFDGSPFHFIEQDEVPTSPTLQFPLDPVAELAKIRAQIRQKQAEYEQRVGRPHQPMTNAARRVSWEKPQGIIPVYKGSYIAV